jgi:hypothetical protein
MTYDHEKRRKRPVRVAEPVQVYLDRADRERLERLAARLDTTKSDVLRQGLAALEAMTRRSRQSDADRAPLPTFRGKGLQPGVDLDDTASLIDLMDGRASR